MKKTCNGCRALDRHGCSLKHKTEITRYSVNGHAPERKPLEECPKPKTHIDLLSLLQHYGLAMIKR